MKILCLVKRRTGPRDGLYTRWTEELQLFFVVLNIRQTILFRPLIVLCACFIDLGLGADSMQGDMEADQATISPVLCSVKALCAIFESRARAARTTPPPAAARQEASRTSGTRLTGRKPAKTPPPLTTNRRRATSTKPHHERSAAPNGYRSLTTGWEGKCGAVCSKQATVHRVNGTHHFLPHATRSFSDRENVSVTVRGRECVGSIHSSINTSTSSFVPPFILPSFHG